MDPDDVEFLIENAKPDAELYEALNNGYQLISQQEGLPTVGNSLNVWPFVTSALFQQLQSTIRIRVSGCHVCL